MKFDELLKDYPRIRWARPSDQTALFSVIDDTALASSDLQVSFDRRPDFFGFLKVQGDTSAVFTFHNKDQAPHGFACLTFRKMKWKGQPIALGYASDLRTTARLDREARVEWRKMYGLAIRHSHEIEEFNHAIGFVTAVWHENKAAQKALVSQTKSKDFQYLPANEYHSYSIWGRWKFWKRPRHLVRPVKPSEIPLIEKNLFESGDLSWDREDFQRTLQVFQKNFQDFSVLEVDGKMQAFALTVSQSQLKKLVIKSWPNSLQWASRLLPLFGKRAVRLNEKVEMMQLVFFRSLEGAQDENLQGFIDHFWRENSKKPAQEQFNILNYFSWGSKELEIKKWGYFSTSVSGSLYKVVSDSTHPAFREIQDFSCLEGNFL